MITGLNKECKKAAKLASRMTAPSESILHILVFCTIHSYFAAFISFVRTFLLLPIVYCTPQTSPVFVSNSSQRADDAISNALAYAITSITQARKQAP